MRVPTSSCVPRPVNETAIGALERFSSFSATVCTARAHFGRVHSGKRTRRRDRTPAPARGRAILSAPHNRTRILDQVAGSLAQPYHRGRRHFDVEAAEAWDHVLRNRQRLVCAEACRHRADHRRRRSPETQDFDRHVLERVRSRSQLDGHLDPGAADRLGRCRKAGFDQSAGADVQRLLCRTIEHQQLRIKTADRHRRLAGF